MIFQHCFSWSYNLLNYDRLQDVIIGLIKLNPKVLAEIDYSNSIDKKNNFIELILNQTSKGELCEMCVFDIIMLINLISNRSFIDLHQYPIFPLLYFYTVCIYTYLLYENKKYPQFERGSALYKIFLVFIWRNTYFPFDFYRIEII